MFQKYFVSAYASSRVLQEWDEASETRYFKGLAVDPRIAGVEIPYQLEREVYPIVWLEKNIPPHWQLVITSLPAIMELGEKNPKAGLASSSEPDRQCAVALIEKIRSYAEALQQVFGRPLVKSVTLYSSPKNKNLSSQSIAAANGCVAPVLAPSSTLSTLLGCAPEAPCPSSTAATLKTSSNVVALQSSKEAFERSLTEILKMNWGSITLNLEHCDAFTSEYPSEKGFLSLADEIQALEAVGDIGLVLNWARSAIETRSSEGPRQHLREALSHQLLRGFVFSGCASDPQSLYGAWKDKHAPPHPLCLESLLREKEISAVFEVLKHQELSEEFYLGIKISNRFSPFEIQRSVELNLETIDLIEVAAEN